MRKAMEQIEEVEIAEELYGKLLIKCHGATHSNTWQLLVSSEQIRTA
jgi:hypothetical protein